MPKSTPYNPARYSTPQVVKSPDTRNWRIGTSIRHKGKARWYYWSFTQDRWVFGLLVVEDENSIGALARHLVDAPSHFTARAVLGVLLAIGSNPDNA